MLILILCGHESICTREIKPTPRDARGSFGKGRTLASYGKRNIEEW
jgi:hypothetical protein